MLDPNPNSKVMNKSITVVEPAYDPTSRSVVPKVLRTGAIGSPAKQGVLKGASSWPEQG